VGPWLGVVCSAVLWYRSLSLLWGAVARHATAEPDDPDLPEVIARVEEDRRAYLRWGLDTVGFALYLFGRP